MNTVQDLHKIDTGALKRFAQSARRKLREQVAAQIDRVIKSDSAELREKEAAIKELKNQIAASSREAVIERVAYVWFNRFCALRFMDVNQYTRIGTVSPAAGFTQPEILAEAKQGHIDESFKPFTTDQRVFDLLSGRISSRDAQQEAYRLLIVAVCNYYNSVMPFLFEKIADYTELLMPDDLLSDTSILADTRNTLSAEACADVEVIGWLYQFYISEKKDEVFEDLKKNKKVSPENIPAATQLFTPDWIVRFLVENSLGRLWMLNKPGSTLPRIMSYYLKPETEQSNFPRITKAEEIRLCDPACGSGHMLVYAFDLLYHMYEEEGYEPTEIPRLILQNNLYGIEIDERAAELAAFALTMKARAKHRRFFLNPIQPNISVVRKTLLKNTDVRYYFDFVGNNLFSNQLADTLEQFRSADNFGSLIRPKLADARPIRDQLKQKNAAENVLLYQTHEHILEALQQAEFLSAKYHVVITNPPYMGNQGMNAELTDFAKKNFADTKTDLSAMFIERCLELCLSNGFVAMVTMHNWMFLPSFDKFRERILDRETLVSMAHLGLKAFDSLNSKVVSTTAFVLSRFTSIDKTGAYLRLIDGNNESQKEHLLRARLDKPFYCSAQDFRQIPGFPIAYWISPVLRRAFRSASVLGNQFEIKAGISTGKNETFILK